MVLPKDKHSIFRRKILTKIARKALRMTRPHMPSKTLRRDSFIAIDRNEIGYVVVPYYWALYVHEGRGGLTPGNPPKFLVWFANKRDDPRTRGGKRYPRRESDRIRLTSDQWKAGLAENKKRRKRGRKPFMYVRKWVGPVDGTPFFDIALGSGRLTKEAAPIVKDEWERLVEKELISDRATAKIRVFS